MVLSGKNRPAPTGMFYLTFPALPILPCSLSPPLSPPFYFPPSAAVLTLDALYQVKITTIAAGVLFVLLSILWPCTWLWNQYNKTCGCSYAPLITYTWMLTLAYTTIMGALLFGVNEHYDCIHFCHNCTFTKNEQYRCEYVEVSLWTLVAMLALMALFLVVTCVYCFFHCLSCDKEPRRSYTLL